LNSKIIKFLHPRKKPKSLYETLIEEARKQGLSPVSQRAYANKVFDALAERVSNGWE
jgi:hypothetical protein